MRLQAVDDHWERIVLFDEEASGSRHGCEGGGVEDVLLELVDGIAERGEVDDGAGVDRVYVGVGGGVGVCNAVSAVEVVVVFGHCADGGYLAECHGLQGVGGGGVAV